ncbi:MAG TPA: hypothetical protein VHC22_13390 [Pirellulales bacterium]|nr:hypothetical protein [Pirellulales bacterium]
MERIEGLLAKVWKDEEVNLKPGRHYFDETLVVRVRGSVEKAHDQHVTPTVSVPLVTTLALFWEKCGVDRDQALKLLREAISEAMAMGEKEDDRIKQQIDDVAEAITAVRKELLERLPKMPRSGRTITQDLEVTVERLPTVEHVAA